MSWKGWRYNVVPEADSGRIGAREETHSQSTNRFRKRDTEQIARSVIRVEATSLMEDENEDSQALQRE